MSENNAWVTPGVFRIVIVPINNTIAAEIFGTVFLFLIRLAIVLSSSEIMYIEGRIISKTVPSLPFVKDMI